MINRDAYTALLRAVDGLGVLPVAYPNVAVSQQTGAYMKVNVLPVAPGILSDCNGISIYKWILNILICVRDGVGVINPVVYADQIRAALPFGHKLTENSYTFTFENNGEIKPSYSDDAWYLTPVQFRIGIIN